MPVAFDETEVRDYSFPWDTDENKTVWKIGVLDTPLRAYLTDRLTDFSYGKGDMSAPADITLHQNIMYLEAIRYGIKGWENFKDKSGNDIPYLTEMISISKLGNRLGIKDFSLRKIRYEWIEDLGKEVMRLNKLDKEEEKNLSTPSEHTMTEIA